MLHLEITHQSWLEVNLWKHVNVFDGDYTGIISWEQNNFMAKWDNEKLEISYKKFN